MQELCDLRIVGDAEPDDGQQPEFGVEFGGFEPLRFMQQRVDLFDEVGVDREENGVELVEEGLVFPFGGGGGAQFAQKAVQPVRIEGLEELDAETFQFVDIERAELHIVTDVLVLDRVGFRQFVVDRLLLPVDDAEAFVEFAQPLVVVGVLRLELFDGAFLPQREDEDSREQQNRARHDGEQEVEPVLVAGDLLHETLVDFGHRARRDQDTVDRVAVDRVIQTARDVAVGAHEISPSEEQVGQSRQGAVCEAGYFQIVDCGERQVTQTLLVVAQPAVCVGETVGDHRLVRCGVVVA